MNIPDFAVSSQEAGFDKFLKVYNEYFKFDFFGNAKFYGAKNGENYQTGQAWITPITPSQAIALLTNQTTDKMNTLENSCFQFQENDEASKKCIRIMNERYKSASPSLSDNFRGYDNHYYSIIDGMKNCDKNDHSRNEVVISPSDYLALLTGKQLTEGDFAHVSEHQSAMEYLQTPSLKEMESQPKLLPTQESVKDGSLGIEFTEQAQSAFDHYQYPSLINTLDTSAAFWIGWRQAEIFFSTQQTAHIQQQLKEAKENHNIDLITIRNMFVSMMPTGEVKAWDFVVKIKEFISWFDNNYLNK